MTGKKSILLFMLYQCLTQLIGGIIKGKATDNVFNVADMSPVEEFQHFQLPSRIGKVKLYISNTNPENRDIGDMCPAMTAEAPLSNTIQPILEALADIILPSKECGFIRLGHIFIYF